MQFEANRGQSSTSAKYLAHGEGYLLRLEPTRAVLDFDAHAGAKLATVPQQISLSFVGANEAATITGESQLPGVNNYLPTGDPKTWHTGIPTFERVSYRQIYSGIDVSFYGNGRKLEYDVTVAPGADPSLVQLALSGPDTTKIDADGSLGLSIGERKVRLLKPMAYQVDAQGKRVPVEVAYEMDQSRLRLKSQPKMQARAGFRVGNYDRTRALVIDPVVDYSFYVANAASSGTIQLTASATDAAGNTYVAGNLENDFNLFIAKFNAAGQQIFNTLIGTNVYPFTYPSALAFDAAGDVYITGEAYAAGSSWGFPTTSNAFQQTAPSSGYYNPYLAVLKYDGSALTYSTYLNGTGEYSYGDGVAVDSSGNAYISGQAGGTGFPTTAGAFQTTYPSGASSTGFVAKINPAASGAASLVYSTLLGSSGGTYMNQIAVDAAGSAYVTGGTTGGGFPTTTGAYQYNGSYPSTTNLNAFVTKLNASGSALVYSSLLGPGSGNGIAIDGNDDVYVDGAVGEDDFPTTSGAYQTTYPGGFVTELNPQGSALVYSTFLGGPSSGASEASVIPGDIAIAPGCASSCNAYVSGYTTATDFPEINPIQNYVPGGGGDYAFLAELNGTGSQALFSSYFATGPSASLNVLSGTYGPQIGVDSSSNIYVTGDVSGNGLTVTQPTAGTATQGFLAKVAPSAGANLVPVPLTVAFNAQTVGVGTVQQGYAQPTVLLENLGSAAATISSITFSPAGEFTETDNCGGSVPAAGYCTLTLNFLPTNDGFQTSTMTIASTGGNPTVTLTGTGNDGALLTATPGSLVFPNTASGSKSSAQIITIQNVGNQPAGLNLSADVSGAAFPYNTNCTAYLNPSQSCQISVVFAPIQPGYETGTIYNLSATPISLSGTGTGITPTGAGSLGVTPGSLNLGTETDGIAAPQQNFTIINTGTLPVTVNSATVALTSSVGSASDFQIQYCTGTPFVLVPQQTMCYGIIFTPTGVGTETATLTIASSTGTPITVNLTGIGLAATQVLEFEPGNQVFLSQPLGLQTAVQSFYVYNTGTASVLIDRAEISGDFQITNTNCPGYNLLGETIPGFPSASCYVSIAFTPTALGARTGTLTLIDAAGSSQVLSLMGNGVAQTGTLTSDPSGLQFGPQVVGTTSGNDFIALSNPGNSPVTINSFTTTGDYAVNGYSCGTPPYLLNAGGSCQVYVNFTPTTTSNPRTGTLTIGSTAGNQTVSLTGTGVTASQAIAFTPATSLAFGSIDVNTSSYIVPIYVRNPGTEAVTFSKVAAITAGFKINYNGCASSVGQQLAANTSCEIDLYFLPSAVQSYTGTLTLTDTIAGATATQVLNLSGTGISSTTVADMNPQPLQFTQQNPFTTSSPSYFYLYNYGKSATVTIASWSISMGGSGFIAAPGYDSCTGVAIAAKSYCTIGIEFAPQSGGSFTGTVTFTDTSGNTYLGSLAGYAPAVNDAATLSPSALTYPAQTLGATQSSSYAGNYLTFTNTGTTNITLGTLSGANYGPGAEFFADTSYIGDQCSGASLTPGQICYVGIAFAPSAAGARSGAVNFPVNYGDSTTATFTASLAGTGLTVQNTAVVTPTSVSYTDQVVGTASSYQLIRLYNTGNQPLTVGKLSYGASPQFLTDIYSYGDQCSNVTVAPGGNCYIGVDFKPTATGAQTGTLTFPVTYSGASSAVNLTAALSGKGVAVANGVYLSPASVYLGQQIIATTSSGQVISLLNRGDSPVVIGNITYSNTKEFGTDTSYYGDQCSQQTIAVGSGCVVGIDFTPSASGARTSTLSFPVTYSSGTKTAFTAALTGTGLATTTGLTYSQTTVTFPSEQMGVQSQGVTVQISNPTQTPATFTLAVGGTNPGDFNVYGCGGVSAQSSCPVYIYFTPGASGARSATVTLSSYSGPGTAPTLTLKGTGAADAAALSVYPSTLAFSTTEPVGVGTPGQVITITNNGSVAAAAITKVSTTDTAEFPVVANNCVGAVLQPNQSCALTVVFSPTSTGAKTGTISITPAQGATSVTVSGTGTADVGSTVTLASSTASAALGTLVKLTATVSASGAPVTNGTVTFYAGAKLLGSAQVVTTTAAGGTIGNATLYTNSLPLGANSITATYAGADSPGTASAITVTITGQYASVNVLSSTGLQGSYSLLSTISGLGSVNPTGSVTYNDLQTSTVLGTATVSSATASQSFYTAGTPTLQPYPGVTALVDVNHDGKLDLITGYGQVGPTSLTVSLGDGDGTFQAPISVDSVNYTIGRLAFGDFNGDGNIDIVAATDSNEILVFLGKGNGAFGDAVGYGSGGFYGIAVGDFNGDGKLDIVATDASNQSVDLMLGNGDGTFQDEETFPSPGGGSGQSIVVGDFNNDGKLDVAAGPGYNSSTGYYQVEVLLGNGNGTLQTALTIPTTGYYPYQLAVGDVNGDGNLDILTNDDNNEIGVLTGKGTGAFNAEQVILTGTEYNNPLLADINNDGKLDIVTSNANSGLLYVALGNGNGTFGAPVGYPTGSSPYIPAVGDINGDGKADIVVANYQSSNVTILLNQVTETATLTGVTLPGTTSDNVSATYSGDTNYLSSTSNVLNLPSNAGTGSTTLTVTPATGAQGTDFTMVATAINAASAPVAGGTITFYNGSTVLGTVEIVSTGPSAGTATYLTHSLPVGSNNLSARFNGTDANQASASNHVTVTVTGPYPTATTLTASGVEGNYTLSAALEAFGPGTPTGSLVFTDTSTSTTLGTVALTSGALTQNFVPPTGGGVFSIAGGLTFMSQGDLNNDGYPDLVVANNTAGVGVTVLLGSGNGQFVQSSVLSSLTALCSALADVNGDGKLDLIVGTGSALSVYLGSGDGTFQTTPKFTTAIDGSNGNTLSLDTGDVNGDGKIDVVVTDANSNQVYVLTGNGDGTFGTPAPFNTGGTSPRQVVIRDFNGDGKLDVAVANYNTNTVGVLFGNGDGTLQTAITIGGFSVYSALASADVNGDGQPDLVVAGGGQAVVVLNSGGGTFASPVGYSVPGGVNYTTILDVTGDGIPDLVVAEGSGGIEVLPGTGTGTFGTPVYYSSGTSSQNEVLVGDFNADGRNDFASLNNNNTVSVLLNTVTEGATITGITLPGSGTDNVVAAYSGDSNFSGSTSPTLTLYSTPSGTTTTLAVSPGANEPLGTALTFTATVTDTKGAVTHGTVGFFNGTTLLGTAQLIGTTDTIGTAGTAVFTTKDLQTGTASITAKFTASDTDTTSASATQSITITAVAVATTTTLTSTGNVGAYTLKATVKGSSPLLPTGTVTFTDTTASPNYVLGSAPMSGSGGYSLTSAVNYATGTNPDQVLVADMNHDGNPDLIIGNYDGTMVSVLLGNGNGTFAPQNEYGTNYNGVYGLAVGDLNGDGIPDVITANGATLGVLPGTNTGALGTETDYSGGNGAYGSVAVGDFNRDGKLDVVAINGSGTLNVYMGNGDGTLQAPKTYTAGSDPLQVAVADFNGDGIPDLAVANYNDGSIGILLGNGDGTFQTQVEYAEGANPRSLAVADVNGDGKLDVVAANSGTNTVSVLLGNSNGTLQAATPVTVGSNPYSVQIGDLNGDGYPDLVVANEGGGTVGVLLGNDTGAFQVQTTITATTPWSIAVSDFNNDGRLDVASVDYSSANLASIFLNQQVETAVLTPVSVPGSGTHNVIATYSGDTNFATSTSSSIELGASSASSTIALAPTPNNATITYGATLSVLVTVSGPTGVNTPTGKITYTVAGGTAQTATLNSSGTATLSLTSLQAGTPSLVVNYAGDSLHSAAPQQTLAITVNKAPLSVVGNNVSRTYGAANPAFTGTITGLQYSDTASATYATTATVTSGVGTYAIVPTPTISDPANYTLTSTNGVLTVTPASLTVTVANATKIYGAANPTFTDTLTGVQNSDSITVTLATTATTTSAVGTYPITATLIATPAVLANYTQTVNNGTLTITHQPLTVTANNATRLYGAANPTFSGTVVGLQGSDTVTVTYASSATATSSVGSYSIVPTVTGAALSNYTLTTVNGALSVTTAPLTIVVNNASRTYGAANPTFTGTVTGLLSSDTVTTTYSTTAVATSPVGTYPISAAISGTKAGNYTATVTNGSLTVGAAPLTVTVNSISKVYGSTNPTFSGTVTGLQNGDGITTTYSTTAAQYSSVGMYPITATVSGVAASNYTVTVVPGTLTVTQAILQIAPNNGTRVYGAANPTFTGTVTGILNNDNVVTTYSTTATVSTYVGSYSITATISGTAAGNYNPQVTPGSLSITPAPLAVSVNAATKVYGAALPSFTTTYTTLLNGDVLTPTYSTSATASSAVGGYSVTETLAGAALVNYTPTYSAGTLNVTPAPLSLSVANASRPYGAANPTFTGALTGVLNGDTITPTYSTTAITTSSVGTYPITATLAGPNLSNYTQTVTPGTLTLTTAPLTITAANASRIYGAANPTFTGTTTGLLNGDTVTVTYSTAATATSPAGSYPITATVSGTASFNYTATVNVASLAVSPAALTIVINNATRVYQAANPTFTGTVTGLLNGDTVTLTYTTTATASSSVGSYPITATISGSAASNYSPSVTPGSLSITALQTAAPTIAPAAGIYTSAQSVTIADATAGATIYYAFNATPTTSSPVYSGPITVSASETVEALALGSGGNYSQSAVTSATYTINAAPTATPLISPAAGTYIAPLAVTITDATAGATIYYTTNGTAPTTASTAYTGPFSITTTSNANGVIAIEAIAVSSGAANSAVASNSYTLQTPAPVFSPAPGAYSSPQSITLTSLSGATIHYTTDGSKPTTSSPTYTKAIPFSSGTLTISALAHATNEAISAIATGVYTTATPAATPTFSPVAGSYTAMQSVAITDTTAGATIYYTTNGTTPTTSSSVYSGPINVSSSETINAIAAATGYANSAVGSAAYTITLPAATPTIGPVSGTYPSAQSVTISDTTPGVTIYYAINGTPSTSSAVYTGPITVSATETVSAIASGNGYGSSPVASASYTIISTVTTPVISPAGGSYSGPQTITIADATIGATIYYTTNGTTPTTASAAYTGPITISTSSIAGGAPIVIEAIAAASGATNSGLASNSYMIATPAPAFSPAPGAYSTAQSITLTSSPGAVIHYTTDGSKPYTSSPTYTKPIPFTSGTLTISALAHLSGEYTSTISTGTYTFGTPAATPTFTPVAGSYTSAQSVNIVDTTSGSTIYYTTDGSTPTTSSSVYSGPIAVATTETINAIAVASGFSNSAVGSAAYTITVPAATPVISPAGGTYNARQSVTIADSTPGATIYYAINGTPTTSSTVYTGPIPVSTSETISAIAGGTGFSSSSVATGSFTISLAVAAPTISPAAGSYVGPQTVTIADATPGSLIYYTTNGTTPTTASTQYTGPFTINLSSTSGGAPIVVEAIAAANGTTSTVASSSYMIATPAPVFSPAPGNYTSAQSITLTSSAGAVIHYTTDGSKPNTSSPTYTKSIPFTSGTLTISALAHISGEYSSTIATGTYTMTSPSVYAGAGLASGNSAVAEFNANTDVASGSFATNNPYSLGQVALAPNGQTLYAVQAGYSSDNTISVINTATSSVISSIGLNEISAYGIAVSPNGAMVYVTTNAVPSYIEAINASTNAVTPIALPANTGSTGVAFSPDSKTAYVSYYSNTIDAVAVVNVAAGTYTSITTGNGSLLPLSVAMSPDGSTVYVANENADSVTVISTASNTVTGTIQLPVTTTVSPNYVAVSPNGNSVCILTQGETGSATINPAVYCLNTVNNVTTAQLIALPAGSQVGSQLAFSADSSTVFAPVNLSNGSSEVVVINPNTGAVTTDISRFNFSQSGNVYLSGIAATYVL